MTAVSSGRVVTIAAMKTLVLVLVSVAVIVSASVSPAAPTAQTCSYRSYGALPDARCTPGATNPAVTQGDIRSTICTPGWVDTIRPPLAVTEPEKVASIRQYGARFGSNLRAYEYDHLIPLELGGAVNDPRNLWAEPGATPGGHGSYDKDTVENHLNALVCNGKTTLAAAQHTMATDWRSKGTP